MKDSISLKDANRLYVYSVLQEVFEYLREQDFSSVVIAGKYAKHAVSILKDHGMADENIRLILTNTINQAMDGEYAA